MRGTDRGNSGDSMFCRTRFVFFSGGFYIRYGIIFRRSAAKIRIKSSLMLSPFDQVLRWHCEFPRPPECEYIWSHVAFPLSSWGIRKVWRVLISLNHWKLTPQKTSFKTPKFIHVTIRWGAVDYHFVGRMPPNRDLRRVGISCCVWAIRTTPWVYNPFVCS